MTKCCLASLEAKLKHNNFFYVYKILIMFLLQFENQSLLIISQQYCHLEKYFFEFIRHQKNLIANLLIILNCGQKVKRLSQNAVSYKKDWIMTTVLPSFMTLAFKKTNVTFKTKARLWLMKNSIKLQSPKQIVTFYSNTEIVKK